MARKWRRSFLFFPLLILASLLSSPLNAQLINEVQSDVPGGIRRHDRHLSDIYLEYAVEAFKADNIERAEELSHTALLFDRHSPDALFMRAFAAEERGEMEEAARLLSRSLLYQQWRSFRRIEAANRLAKLYYRSGRSEEAFHLLQGFYPELLSSENTASLYVSILLKLGFEDRARRLLRTVEADFPASSELQLLRFRYDPSYRALVLEKLVEGDRQELYTRALVREAVYSLLEAHTAGSDREGGRGAPLEKAKRVIELYENRWSADRSTRTAALLSSLYEELAEAGEGIEKIEGLQRLESRWRSLINGESRFTGEDFTLLREAAEQLSKQKEEPLSTFASFSGEILFDDNSDGYFDRRIEYEGGELKSLALDRDQNGEYERVVRLSERAPRGLRFLGVTEVDAQYGSYPNLKRAVYSTSSERIGLELVPYEVDFDILIEEQWSPLSPPTIAEGESFPDFETLLPYASRIERNAEASRQLYDASQRRSTIYPTARREERIEGRFLDGELEQRMRDIDGDGIDELTENYRDGQLISILYDGNGNNRAEYKEIYQNGERIRLWDIDEDGTYDYEMRMDAEK